MLVAMILYVWYNSFFLARPLNDLSTSIGAFTCDGNSNVTAIGAFTCQRLGWAIHNVQFLSRARPLHCASFGLVATSIRNGIFCGWRRAASARGNTCRSMCISCCRTGAARLSWWDSLCGSAISSHQRLDFQSTWAPMSRGFLFRSTNSIHRRSSTRTSLMYYGLHYNPTQTPVR